MTDTERPGPPADCILDAARALGVLIATAAIARGGGGNECGEAVVRLLEGPWAFLRGCEELEQATWADVREALAGSLRGLVEYLEEA